MPFSIKGDTTIDRVAVSGMTEPEAALSALATEAAGDATIAAVSLRERFKAWRNTHLRGERTDFAPGKAFFDDLCGD